MGQTVLYAALALLLASSGCQRATYYSTQAKAIEGSSVASLGTGTGSGGGYEGRVVYLFRDANHPCVDLDSDGNPLPNAQITILESSSGRAAQLDRSDCATLSAPKPVAMSDLQFAADGSGDLTYQGNLYTSSVRNLDLYSSSFDQSVWFKGETAVTSNAAIAPDGTRTASLLTEFASDNYHSIGQAVSAPNDVPYACSVFVKMASGFTSVQLKLYEQTSYTDDFFVDLDLTSGATYPGSDGTGVVFSGSATAYPGGWYRIQLTGQLHPSSPTNPPDCTLFLMKQIQPDNGYFMGDGASGVYFGAFSSIVAQTSRATSALRAERGPNRPRTNRNPWVV